MNAALPCTVARELNAHLVAGAASDAHENDVTRELETMRADGARLFAAMGEMSDDTLRALCNCIAAAASAIDADDRLAAVHDMAALIDAANRPAAIAAVKAADDFEEADHFDRLAESRGYSRY